MVLLSLVLMAPLFAPPAAYDFFFQLKFPSLTIFPYLACFTHHPLRCCRVRTLTLWTYALKSQWKFKWWHNAASCRLLKPASSRCCHPVRVNSVHCTTATNPFSILNLVLAVGGVWPIHAFKTIFPDVWVLGIYWLCLKDALFLKQLFCLFFLNFKYFKCFILFQKWKQKSHFAQLFFIATSYPPQPQGLCCCLNAALLKVSPLIFLSPSP